jgi:hypothetical protein
MRSAIEALYRGASNGSRYRAVVVATGGGSQALGWLLSVPGASSVILECSVPYSRASSDALLAPLALSSVPQTYGSCSRETSIALARSACFRAMQLAAVEDAQARADEKNSSSDDGNVVDSCALGQEDKKAKANEYWSESNNDDVFVGIGVTGALASKWPKRGDHRCFVTVSDSLARTCVREMTFEKGRRDRLQEDDVCSRVAVRALLAACGHSEAAKSVSLVAPSVADADVDVQVVDGGGMSTEGEDDGWVEKTEEDTQGVELSPMVIRDGASEDSGGVYSAINELFDQALVKMVVCVPRPTPTQSSTSAVTRVVPFINALPMANAVVLPGSFNPVHRGHRELAQRACDLASAHFGKPYSAVFEITTDNADKGQMDRQEAQKRVDQFAPPASNSASNSVNNGNDDGGGGVGVGRGWAVALTQTARFVEKAHLFPNSVFVLGVDTGVRLIDPKYYNNDVLQMQEALLQIRQLGCHIIVAGRKVKLNKGEKEEEGEERFETFESAMKDKLPALLQGMFLSLGEHDFRVDLSSTEIRRQRQLASEVVESG